MSNINNASIVSGQYSDDKNLSIRIALHKKYSTNKYGYANWIFDSYKLFSGCSILELGCGNGSMWEDNANKLPDDSKLILSDISKGMIEIVTEKFKDYPNISVESIDIQDIPYPDNTFDIIIANSMLYHVPDLNKAVSEVYRVLKQGGIFYAATAGANGMNKYLNEKLKEFNPAIDAFRDDYSPFSLQNGKGILGTCFKNIEMHEYEDSLEITETSDLINWILSTISMSRIDKNMLIGLDEFFEKCKDQRGIIKIPKHTGIFVSIK